MLCNFVYCHLHFVFYFYHLQCYILFLRTPPRNLDKQTTITVDDKTFTVHADDLIKICDLGRGAYGIVEKMKHIPSDTTMAVKVRLFITVSTNIYFQKCMPLVAAEEL